MRWRLAWAFVLSTGCNPGEDQPPRAPETITAVPSRPPVEALPEPPPPAPDLSAPSDQGHLRNIDCVYLQPLGDVSAKTTQIVREALETTYGVELRIGPHRPLPDDAFYQPRRRYRADTLLDHLDAWLPDDCDRIVGITHKDISTTKGEHEDWGILGLGRVPGKSCVVSSFRVRKKLAEVPADERLARVAIHELGHTLGLPHCPTLGCLMEDAQGSVVTIDRETHLCERCLRKIGWLGELPPARPEFD
ncbi:hypothetical protein DB30_01565 [Enhygromyxa salina]|uniref:Archaemetzincin n=1 Tax=Enhygromyxa salina TaxID=215803 RepID=A0A0C1ZMQ6_9BACT|nr:matrixin family metalloprotease [Enhygromyxa salina]KIG12333.1 hypothetical protein DB30_01565 [Enhygromyxa salina]